MKYYAIELNDPHQRYVKFSPATKHNKRKLKEVIGLADEGHLSLFNDITEFVWSHFDELAEDKEGATYVVTDGNLANSSVHPTMQSAWEEAKYLELNIEENHDYGNEVLIMELLTNKE